MILLQDKIDLQRHISCKPGPGVQLGPLSEFIQVENSKLRLAFVHQNKRGRDIRCTSFESILTEWQSFPCVRCGYEYQCFCIYILKINDFH